MKSLTLRTNIVRPQKMCRAPFLFAPLALIVCAGVQAAIPGAGTLGNQLRQESVRTPPAPAGAPLLLPEDGQGRRALSADNHTTVTVRKVVFTGNPPGLRGLSEADLQRELTADLNRPQTFAGLEIMAQKITDLYRRNGLLVARAALPPQTLKDGVLTLPEQRHPDGDPRYHAEGDFAACYHEHDGGRRHGHDEHDLACCGSH
ncbi:hypothetical protein NMP65_003529 [Salmonella enterica]|nr:hypothetical protein [Salmonella enterica]